MRRVTLPPSLQAKGLRFRHCLLSEEGYIVVSMQASVEGRGGGGGGGGGVRLQVWTVNGNIVAERELATGGGGLVRLALLGATRGNGGVLMAAREDGLVEFLGVMDLETVGSYCLTVPPPPLSSHHPSSSSSPTHPPPHLACVDAGPDAATPVLLACGTRSGSLVVVGLPLLHFIKELETGNSFTQALLQSFPIKMAKDAVNIAATTIATARGMASQAKGVALEALGEAKTIVQEMKRSGLSGVWGLLKGDR